MHKSRTNPAIQNLPQTREASYFPFFIASFLQLFFTFFPDKQYPKEIAKSKYDPYNRQLDGRDPGAAHISVGVGDKAPELAAVVRCRHLHPQGVGGGVAAGQVLEVVGSRSTVQPLVDQSITLGNNDTL